MKQLTGIIAVFLTFGLLLSGCSASKGGSGKSFKRNVEVSYYADKFDGKKTSSGEKFRNSDLTAAHRSLPFGTKIRVTNPVNGKSVVVRINDRGPQKGSRELDLSRRAFMEITDNKNHGTLKVNLEIL